MAIGALAQERDALIARLHDGFVETLQTVEIHAHLLREIERAGPAAERASPFGFPITVIEGPARCGKTRVVTEFLRRWRGGQCILIDLPARASCKDLTRLLLESLQEPAAREFAESRTHETERIEELLQLRQTRMIVFDRADALFDAGRSAVLRETLRWLERLADFAGLPIVIVGRASLREKLAASAELDGRIGRRFTMELFDWAKRRTDFRYILAQFERMLALPGASNLGDPAIAEGIHRSTAGVIGSVVRLLEAALKAAPAEQPIDSISEADLHRAVAWLNIDPHNPFREAS